MAATGEVPFDQYYGSIDSTPLFVILAGRYLRRTNDVSFILELWDNITAALHWIEKYGDIDGDGFVEYQRRSSNGLDNQGWKDSSDSVSHENGDLATGPIALCEVQGYVYEAKYQAAYMAERLARPAQAEQLQREAELLKHRFNHRFWDAEMGSYALALDGEKRPCRVLSSNAGHCLFTGIATPERAAITARTLLGREMFTGWGIRTLGEGEARYNPMSYHNGSVWPHDTAIIGAGFARYGLTEEVLQLLRGLFEASLFIELQRMPELFCGFNARPGEAPTAYPVACSPQAWSVATVFLLLQSFLGFDIDAAEKVLRFENPQLPAYIDELEISNLPVDDQLMRLKIMRRGRGVDIRMRRKPADWKEIIS
jgi:glycogen debranching enzyme